MLRAGLVMPVIRYSQFDVYELRRTCAPASPIHARDFSVALASHLSWLVGVAAHPDAQSFYEKTHEPLVPEPKEAAAAYLIRGRGKTVASAGRAFSFVPSASEFLSIPKRRRGRS
jgi:hypothetical protein